MAPAAKEKTVKKSSHVKDRGRGSRPKSDRAADRRPTKSETEAIAAVTKGELPLELLQLVLNVFQNTFAGRLADGGLTSLLQEVKGHLYNRDFDAAFGREEYLEAYAARWSPARALGYLKIFDSVIKDRLRDEEEPGEGNCEGLKVSCIGGGAGAEVAALAGAVRYRSDGKKQQRDAAEALEELRVVDQTERSVSVHATFVDMADWRHVIDKLQQSITTAPPLSAYASAAAKANNVPLVSSTIFDVSFRQADVLAMDDETLRNVVTGKDLVTICFTLNELYATSLAKTQAFLLRLTGVVVKGSLLLVVDSAGSYSTVSLNGKEKKYPMHWLLDHALLKDAGYGSAEKQRDSEEAIPNRSWEKLRETESEWFRVPVGLEYPLELENMRYQLHLYRKL
ncbi:uncharacterized protein PV09_05022 [Verruconis gallopava]|uniref:25S rRNA (Uridine(2843)-N(3))-methyltransferase n=1 Tax=Verruconis gallopava TaxID=253628 RepID=A0A0D2AX03_9PEZI|nr:uncharacterized protein PV09_05022 [Verruconis gallopava]KIW03709.1 hypothetical protein PV09_05022 [Verruconis gallopava]